MNGQRKFFHLKIIDVKNIIPHEEFDDSRANGLIEKIKKTQLFINPILVAHVDGEKYMQIDGMNRYFAIKKLGIKSILAQVVDYNDINAVDVSTWCHLNKLSKKEFLEKLTEIKKITFSEVGYKYLRRRFIRNKGSGYLCTVVFDDGSVYRIATSGNLADKINVLKKIITIYKSHIKRDILPDDANSIDTEQLFKKHIQFSTLLIFPSFTRDQIIDAAVYKHVLFPCGITRFIIQNRCLDVDLPLDHLQSRKSAAAKNVLLEKYLEHKRYRIYVERTVYFEP